MRALHWLKMRVFFILMMGLMLWMPSAQAQSIRVTAYVGQAGVGINNGLRPLAVRCRNNRFLLYFTSKPKYRAVLGPAEGQLTGRILVVNPRLGRLSVRRSQPELLPEDIEIRCVGGQ